MEDENTVTVTVSGPCGSGKTTIATLIRNLLLAQNVDVKIKLTNNEMIPCPTTQRQRIFYLQSQGLNVKIIEVDSKS